MEASFTLLAWKMRSGAALRRLCLHQHTTQLHVPGMVTLSLRLVQTWLL